MGAALTIFLAGAAFFIAPFLGAPTPLIALVLGMTLARLYHRAPLTTGIDFSARTILRIGIALLGFRIVAGDILALGWEVVAIIACAIALVMSVGILGTRLLNLNKNFGILSAGAVSICGASAAMAIASVLPDSKDKSRNLSLSIIAITLFSTLGMILYPILGPALGLNGDTLAIFMGAVIHDVAQTAGAGYSVSPEIGDTAVLTKMIRVSFIAPVIFCIALAFKSNAGQGSRAAKLPLFLIAFFTFMAINSLINIPPAITDALNQISKFALLTALAAIGMKTNLKEITTLGPKPLILMVAQLIILIAIIYTAVTLII